MDTEEIRLEMQINSLEECLFKTDDILIIWEILDEIEEIKTVIYNITIWKW